MSNVTLLQISSGYNLTSVNYNFQLLEDKINDEILHRVGGNNTMGQVLDMNGFSIINTVVDVNNPDSLLTVGDGDSRYYNIDGDTLQGDMNAGGFKISGLALPLADSGAVRKDQLDAEIAARAAGDANLQAQLTGNVPLEASAFSVISWHDQNVANSVTIPDNKNAWSFGPTITIDPGQVVTIGSGSFWTIANGEVQ